MRVLILLISFFFVSALFIISNENLHLTNKEEALKFGDLYYSWFLDIGENFFGFTGYVVKLDWLPETNQSEIG